MAVAIYARQSIEKDNSKSCETQIENCLPRLNPDEQKGKILQFIDRGCTGANTNREGFQKMMRKVEQGVITKIIVYRRDRIRRSLVDFCKILDTLNKHNVKFVSTEEGFDTSTDYGMLVCKILMVFAEHERNSIIARVKDAYESRSNKQIYMGGRRPYGYQFENIMIDDITGEGICVIDLDTVMPGSLLYDYGDSLRFGTNPAEEDEKDLSKVYCDLELFEQFTKGYMEELKDTMTEREKELMPFSAKLMTFECGIRFLADYLNGDTYFKVKREDHNLDRCRTQFKLVSDMEEKESIMKEIVKKYD